MARTGSTSSGLSTGGSYRFCRAQRKRRQCGNFSNAFRPICARSRTLRCWQKKHTRKSNVIKRIYHARNYEGTSKDYKIFAADHGAGRRGTATRFARCVIPKSRRAHSYPHVRHCLRRAPVGAFEQGKYECFADRRRGLVASCYALIATVPSRSAPRQWHFEPYRWLPWSNQN